LVMDQAYFPSLYFFSTSRNERKRFRVCYRHKHYRNFRHPYKNL
jgi:hypothetical protein